MIDPDMYHALDPNSVTVPQVDVRIVENRIPYVEYKIPRHVGVKQATDLCVEDWVYNGDFLFIEPGKVSPIEFDSYKVVEEVVYAEGDGDVTTIKWIDEENWTVFTWDAIVFYRLGNPPIKLPFRVDTVIRRLALSI